MRQINPLLRMDYPDPDVIRVGDVFYMASTTMHFFPGCEILRSRDLVHWEHAAFVYEHLDGLKKQRLEGDEQNYGHGMWAPCLRYHKGRFYVLFISPEMHQTYLYFSSSIDGPWERLPIEGDYYDASLLFDEDRVFIVHGNDEIRLTELKPDLSGPKSGGLDRIIVSDHKNPVLGYEGSHIYHIGEYYYLFLIHSLRTQWKRVQACFRSKTLDAFFDGGDILCDDRGYCGQGVAQGGIVDDPAHNWWSILFQDHGAVGRIPVLIPVTWEDGWPVLGDHGKIPEEFPLYNPRNSSALTPLWQSDDFAVPSGLSPAEYKRRYGCYGFNSVWQFNHEPTLELVHMENGRLHIQTGKTCRTLTQAQNTLTQRALFPRCAAEVTLDASCLNDGDTAGICALQSCYGLIGLRKKDGQLYLVMQNRISEDETNRPVSDPDTREIVQALIPWTADTVRLRIDLDFDRMKDTAVFSYLKHKKWNRTGPDHKLYFKLDHFTGCRFGLFVYSEKTAGGTAVFSDFCYVDQ